MNDKIIYTHNEAVNIIDMFEEVLNRYDIKVPSPEDGERGDDNMAGLYGSTYSDLLEDVENSLIELLGKHTEGTEIIPYVFSNSEGC